MITLKKWCHTSKTKTINQKRNQKKKLLTTLIKPFDTFVIIATTSSTFTVSVTGIGLKVIPTSAAVACGISTSNKAYMR